MSWLTAIKEAWREASPSNYRTLSGRVIKMWEHAGWGDSVSWSDVSRGRIVGWLRHMPTEGDEIQARMKSGKVGRFIVREVEYCGDPRDMFFAQVEFFGYVGEVVENKFVREAVI